MTIPREKAISIIENLSKNYTINNLFAQSHAKHVLHEVNELPENFPAFDPDLEDKVTFAAYELLTASCSLIEEGLNEKGIEGLEKAASLLINVHGPFIMKSKTSGFHVLVSSMAFYASAQYSRAFVAIKRIENHTEIASIITSFIRKDIKLLISKIYNALLKEKDYSTQDQLDELAITVAISRSLADILEYLYTGSTHYFNDAITKLSYAEVISINNNIPSYWLIVRLLKLMVKNLINASLWQSLKPYFVDNSNLLLLSNYIRLMAYNKLPVIELWPSQRQGLGIALNQNTSGGIINLRTSAGKTRVAELAILQTLSLDPNARIIYLAPFRSLALEIEHSLSLTFNYLGYRVSHLYGGSRVSSIDTQLANESSITIATPEKIKAISRSAPEFLESVKLIIIDEGHLIGPSERYVKNEIFIEHLRIIAERVNARILLLSAVLPNPQDLAEWITSDPTSVVSSKWKPAAERFGVMRWNGNRDQVDWLGEIKSFNPSFIESKPLNFGTRRKPFPCDKNEAIAASAVRLTTIGPVMIFTARAVSVPTLAKSVLLAFEVENKIDPHPWPEHEWNVFLAVCEEELPNNSIEIKCAKIGVICHSNSLSTQVRLAMEHLMRSCPPKIIIATTTLAQGVNVGISSVIIASPYISKESIDIQSFWNICGRAGRAFVDNEGKILYVIDSTQPKTVKKNELLALKYFESSNTEKVESGLLYVINMLRKLAAQVGISFAVLLELIANNDLNQLGTFKSDFERTLDLIDDELLSFHEDFNLNPFNEGPEVWIDNVFRNSLASIQARAGDSTPQDVISFLKYRVIGILKQTPDLMKRKSIVSSGLNFSVAMIFPQFSRHSYASIFP